MPTPKKIKQIVYYTHTMTWADPRMHGGGALCPREGGGLSHVQLDWTGNMTLGWSGNECVSNVEIAIA